MIFYAIENSSFPCGLTGIQLPFKTKMGLVVNSGRKDETYSKISKIKVMGGGDKS